MVFVTGLRTPFDHLCIASRAMELEEPEEAQFETSKGVKVISSFDQMGLKDELLRGLYAYGFEKPSAIQQRAIVPVTSGRDVIAQAQSGTGKSSLISVVTCQLVDTRAAECVVGNMYLAWVHSDMQRVNPACSATCSMRSGDASDHMPMACFLRRPQVLILSPTRELAQQTEKVILAIGDYMNIIAHACVGGKSLGKVHTHPHSFSATQLLYYNHNHDSAWPTERPS